MNHQNDSIARKNKRQWSLTNWASCRVLLLLVCTGASGSPPSGGSHAASARTFFFECDDQSGFVARLESGHVWLFLDNASVNLPQRPSAWGVRYQSADYRFWTKGDEASLETSTGKTLRCVNNHSKAIWESARLDGVSFRAVGNEPGWTLRLSADRLVLDLDYGASQYEFKTPEPDIDVESRLTRYQVFDNGQDFLLELSGRPCQDNMSGEAFPTYVHMQLNGRQFQGCGRALH